MTGSPPDMSTLNIAPQRLHDSYDYEGNSPAGRQPYHFATTTGIPAQSAYQGLGVGQSPLKNKPARGGLPTQWMDSPDSRSLSPQNNSDFSSAGGSPPPTSHVNPGLASPGQIGDDEIIPTAIVIKNIPFNVKRETLLDIIASLSIPTPYAFNYHLDQQGSFRGLAFANFRQAADADAVVAALNGFDVQGRKLRVEYKKVLQAGEKERIEREKALRRMRSMQMQKEETTAPPAGMYDEFGYPTQPRAYGATSPYQQNSYQAPPGMPIPSFNPGLSSPPAPPQPSVTPSSEKSSSSNELDLNDPATLEIYSRILLFKDDHMRDELAFSRNLTAKQRRIVHLIAQKLGVFHYSVGEGEERYAVVTRIDPNRRQQPHTLSRAPSAYLAPSGQVTASSLRVKKSMPDMKTLHSQAPRLNTRASNGNLREGYATIASPARRASAGFGTLFGGGGGGFGGVPPVPSLPSSISSGPLNGGGGSGHESPGGVVRQPRGPGVGGFGRRESRVAASEGQPRARTDSLQGSDGRGE
ncbi:hypothetical protein GGG16DRAFT_53475 [Schizophyllum commune]